MRREGIRRRKDDANEVSHIAGVDNFVDRARANNERRRHVEIGPAFGTVEQEISCEVEDDLGATGRQDSFAAMIDAASLRIPKRADGLVEWGGGDALQVEQGDLEFLIARSEADTELQAA